MRKKLPKSSQKPLRFSFTRLLREEAPPEISKVFFVETNDEVERDDGQTVDDANSDVPTEFEVPGCSDFTGDLREDESEERR